jgi:hypothetical protein
VLDDRFMVKIESRTDDENKPRASPGAGVNKYKPGPTPHSPTKANAVQDGSKIAVPRTGRQGSEIAVNMALFLGTMMTTVTLL